MTPTTTHSVSAALLALLALASADSLQLVLKKSDTRMGYVAVEEGAPDRFGLRPAEGVDSVAASSYPCGAGDSKCPQLGFGHGNRVEPILKFNLSAIPPTAVIDSVLLDMRESESLDYDQEVALAPITSETAFAELTWNDLEILHEKTGQKGIGDDWDKSLKDDRTQSWRFSAGGIRKLIAEFVRGSRPNNGVIIRALGSRQQSFDVLSAVSLTVKYHLSAACVRPPRWCSHKGSTYRSIDCSGDGNLDHVCTDTRGFSGIISQDTQCKSVWPHADLLILCPAAHGIVVDPPSPVASKTDGKFSTGFSPGNAGNGWSYWTNAGGALGDWHKYTEMKWNGKRNGYDSTGHDPEGTPLVAADGGKSGADMQSAIIGFKVPETALYAIVESVLSNGDPRAGDLGVTARVYHTDSLVLHRVLPEFDVASGEVEEVSIDAPLGLLRAGEMIFIAISAGPSGKPMHFHLDFEIQQGGCPGSSVSNPPDAARSSTSVWGATAADRATHNQGKLGSNQAWSSLTLDTQQWYQIDAGALSHIAGIALQGRANAAQWVTEYWVTYSTDGEQWMFVDDSFSFPGNSDQTTTVTSDFAKVVTARYIRIHPRKWHGHISLRAGLLICSEWREFKGHRLVNIDRAGKNWMQAQEACQDLGGSLATVDSDEKHLFIESLQPAACTVDDDLQCYYWIGYNDRDIEGKWVWADGSSSKFTKWNVGEPNDANVEDCAYGGLKNGLWNDYHCGSGSIGPHQIGYVCEASLCDASHYYDEEAAQCVEVSSCASNEYVKAVATLVSDVECDSCVNCAGGRKHYWDFEATLKDSATSATAQVLHYAQSHAFLRPQFSSGTPNGRALDLTAGDGYLSTQAVLPGGPKTVSFYIKVKDFEEDAGWIGTPDGFHVGLKNGMIHLVAGQTSLTDVLALSHRNNGRWNHFAVTDDGEGGMEVWQNGEVLGGMDYQGTTASLPGGTIGLGLLSSGEGAADAEFDKVAIYDRVLEASVIKDMGQDYASQPALPPPPPPPNDSTTCHEFSFRRLQSDCCKPRVAEEQSAPVKVASLDACKDMCTETQCAAIKYLPDKRLCFTFSRPAVMLDGVQFACNCFAKQDSQGELTRFFDAQSKQCRDLTKCATGDREIAEPTPTSDRTCGRCVAACDRGLYLKGDCTADKASACVPCPVGHMCSGKGDPVPCRPGFYQNLERQSSCKTCGEHQLADETGSSECEGIAPGFYGVGGTDDAHTGQKPCDAGYYCPGGATDQLPCPADHYQPLTAQATCFPCREGETQPKEGQTECVKGSNPGGDDICPPGTYGEPGAECTTCSTGTYAVLPDSSVCQSCQDSCDPGQYLRGVCTPTTTPQCVKCPAGFKCPGGPDAAAAECGEGEYQDEPGSTDCKVCDEASCGQSNSAVRPGFTTDDSGALVPCPAGKFCPGGTVSAEACPPSSWSGSGKAFCAPWTDCTRGEMVARLPSATRDRACAPCAIGSEFSDTQNSKTCNRLSDCPPGTYTVNEIGDARTDRTCKPCPEGMFSSLANRDCQAWTVCEVTLAEGTSTRDRQCAVIPTADSSGSGSGVTEPAVAPTAPQAPSKSNTALIIGVCAGLFVLVLLVVVGGIMYFRRRMKSAQFDITFTQPNGEEGQLQEVEGTLSFSNPGFDMDRSPLPKGFHTTEDGMLEDF